MLSIPLFSSLLLSTLHSVCSAKAIPSPPANNDVASSIHSTHARDTPPLKWKAVDWSSLLAEERSGVKYKDLNGKIQPLEHILAASGVNMVRQRVWVTDGDYGLDYNLELAKRARNASLDFGLTLYYSHQWTNPGLQDAPPSWPLDMAGLVTYVYDYTLDLCNEFAAANLVPATIALGNEINCGLLWPAGHCDNPHDLAVLLKTASDAVRASLLEPKPQIQIHTAHGADGSSQDWFYREILTAGPLTVFDFDAIGVSHYPFWGGWATTDALSKSLTDLHNAYGKDVMVLQTNWPTACTSPHFAFPADTKDIPVSAVGQVKWIQRLAAAVAAIPGGVGLSYWEPAWIHNPVLGSPCERNVMFGPDGQAYASLGVFTSL